MDKKKDNDQNRLKHNFAVAKIEFCAKIDYFQSKFDNICRDLKETNFCSKSFTDPLSAISICYYLAREVNMSVKQRNVRAGDRFLSVFFVIIRTLIDFESLARWFISISCTCGPSSQCNTYFY